MVEQSYPPEGAVQKKDASTGGDTGHGDDDARVHELAAHGTATPASPLPHLGTIQRLFGRHDVSAVQAHTGTEATASASAMGASAYATGNHVVLGRGTDLFTEAHEAAHVVQQRGGVSLRGGVGAAGDPHEHQADAVATAVVRGESAEPLLDQIAGAGTTSARQVQRRDDPAAPMAADAPTAGTPGSRLDVNNPLGPLGLDPATAMGLTRDWAAVRQWVTTHRLDVSLATSMPGLVKRVRTEVGKQSPGLDATSDQTIATYISEACSSLGIPVAPGLAAPAAGAPASDASSPLVDSVKSALAKIPSLSATVTVANGQLSAVLLGDTPALTGSGAQLTVDTGGATLHAKDGHSDVTIKATTAPGLTFSTVVGPCTFSAGIDPQHWQIGLSFGPGAPDVQALQSVFTNAHAALVAAARSIAGNPSANPVDIYKTAISPNLDRIKSAISAAKAIADVKPGVSVGINATGPVGPGTAAGPAATAGTPGAGPPAMSIQATVTFSF